MPHLREADRFDVHPSYKGGHTVEYGGYIYEWRPEHPKCNQWGFVPQHRMIAEDSIGRAIQPSEVVHHRDHNSLNNAPDNLAVLSRAEHQRHHTQALAEVRKARLTEEMVLDALDGRSIANAAKHLGVDYNTLRNRFPALLAPRQRKSPTRVDDPRVLETIRATASNPHIGYREIAQQYGIAYMTVKRICERAGVPWVKKTRKGERRRQYRRKTANLAA